MNIGSYRGASAMAAYERWQDITAQNIAASSIPGFKKYDVSFEAVAGADKGGAMPQMTTKTSFEQGQLRPTGVDLDFAIQGQGFFKVKRENGEIAYTRNGEFKVSPDGKLVTQKGLPVMGDAGPIALIPGGGTLTVNSEGMILQGGQPVTKMAVYETKNPQSLKRVGDTLFVPGESTEGLKRVESAEVRNGYLESSNVSSLAEMVNLISVSRAYEASQKTLTSGDGSEDKAIQMLGN